MKKHAWKITFLGILIIANANPLYAQPKPENEYFYPPRSQYPGEASKLCKVAPLLPDGHKYTTFLIARYAGIKQVDAYTLTYYSQYPDIDKRYEATPVALKSVFSRGDGDGGQTLRACFTLYMAASAKL